MTNRADSEQTKCEELLLARTKGKKTLLHHLRRDLDRGRIERIDFSDDKMIIGFRGIKTPLTIYSRCEYPRIVEEVEKLGGYNGRGITITFRRIEHARMEYGKTKPAIWTYGRFYTELPIIVRDNLEAFTAQITHELKKELSERIQ